MMSGSSGGVGLTAVAAGLLSCAVAAFAQDDIAPVPNDLLDKERQELESRRTALLERRDKLLATIKSHNAKCSSVREDSPLVEPCGAEQEQLQSEVKRYQDDVDDYRRTLSAQTERYKKRREECNALASRAKSERERIEALKDSMAVSQEELNEWTKLNGEAQSEAVKAAVTFALGEYTAGVDSVRNSVSRLEKEASRLTQKASRARKYKTRLKYLEALRATRDELDSTWTELTVKSISKAGLDADKSWDVARNTMHHELRVASKHNSDLREILKDPRFRETFIGDDLDTPGLDLLAVLTEEAGEHVGKLELGLKHYERMTGPTVRAFVFVRDASYSALLSALSTARVAQHSDVEGKLAIAMGSMQKQFKRTIDTLQECRRSGFAR